MAEAVAIFLTRSGRTRWTIFTGSCAHYGLGRLHWVRALEVSTLRRGEVAKRRHVTGRPLPARGAKHQTLRRKDRRAGPRGGSWP